MKGVVVAPQPIAVEEAVKVLRKGGNAVDAAVTCAFVEMIVDPQMCGIGGFGTMNVYWRDSDEKRIIDFYEQTPSAATDTMFEPMQDTRGGLFWVRNFENQLGYKASGVPGTLLGLYEAMKRYGSISWKEAIMPAAKLARHGIPIHEDLYHYWTKESREGDVDCKTKLTATPESARIFLKNGEFYKPGDTLVLADYANTLETIANEGPEAFYKGKIADRIAQDFQKKGGVLSRNDLEEYRTVITEPVTGTYRGYTVLSSTPPGGGTFVILMLNILESFELERLECNSPEYIHLVAKAQDIAFAERAKIWGDPAFLDLPIKRLTSKPYAEQCRKTIEKGASSPAIGGSHGEETTHLSVIDKHGNAVALTHTLGTSSGVVVPGLGFLFNNSMHRFNPRPGTPNSIAPKKRRASALSPTIVFKDRNPVLVLGGAGGFGIITGVLQTILNVIDHKMTLSEAVSSPRFHSENNLIYTEARIPEETCQQLRSMGHKVNRRSYSYEGLFGNVSAIKLDWKNNTSVGAADPRRGGMALYA